MKRLTMLLLVLFSTVSLFAQTKIILDMDIDTDCDDAGALAILHALADKGEAEILATVVSTRYPYSAPCVEAINRYYGRPNIPIGAPKTTWADTGSRGSAYAHQISTEYETTLNSNDDAPDAVRVYRQILADQESNSVVILTVGYLTNIRDLLASGPDDISPLTGMELIRQKVSRWVQTGASYPSDYNPAVFGNYTPDPTSAHIAFRDWPEESVPMYISGEGNDIQTGGLLPGTPVTNPVRRVYELRVGLGNTRASWDQIGTLFAVRPNNVRWTFRTNGYYYIFENGTYEWRTTPDKNQTVLEYNTSLNAELRQTIDQLMIQPPKLTAPKIEKLAVSANNRFLQTESGKSFFPIADTAWQIDWKLNREDVLAYLQTRKDQKYNVINLVAFPMDGTAANAYGDQPFQIVDGKYDPLQPITTSGNDPADSTEYDYWDHLDFIINSAHDMGLYVVMLPAWGSRIAGDWGDGHPNSDVILDVNNASNYACWISARYQNYTNIIWMLGGDRSAIYDGYDYRPAFRKMADGVLAGNTNRPVLMSYHPRKYKPNSSEWFHNDSWLSFNSIQDQPSDQLNSIRHDYALSPAKPTWLFEGGYEERNTASGVYNDWQVRFQAYQTVFAGGFGYTYGHMSIWDFDSDWRTKIQASGAKDMQHLDKLMSSLTSTQFFGLVPDQSLIDGDTGSMSGSEGIFSTCIVATRTSDKDLAMIYCANGRNIHVKMSGLSDTPKRALWFNPRDGSVTLISSNVVSGSGAPIHEFDPPDSEANGNDYVLVLDLGTGLEPGPGPDPDPGPDMSTAFFADTFNNVSSVMINDQTNALDRQFGPAAPLDYAGDGSSTSTTYIVSSKAVMSEGFQIRGHNACYISPNHNFNDMGKDFTVEIDAKINVNGSWSGFSFNIGAESQHEVIDTLGGPLNGHVSGLSWWLDKTGNSSAPQLIIGGQNFVSADHIFKNSEISNIRDEEVHLTALVHAESFGGLDKVTTAFFVNGEPFVGDAAGVGAMFELNRAFTNVWIVLGEEAGLHDTTVTMDNFRVTKTTPRIAESAWTDDASSSIDSSKTYTHAVNIGHVGDVVINGVTFTGSGSGSSQTGTDWKLLNYSNDSNMGIVTENNSSISGAGSNLVSDCAYSEVNSTLTISGLTPGEKYTLTLFNNATTAGALDTYIIPSDSEAALNVVDQNQAQGSVFRYDYIAPENGVFTMTFNNNNGSSTPSGNFRLYAFSNEVNPGDSADTIFNGGDLFTAGNWSAGLPAGQTGIASVDGTGTGNQINPWINGGKLTVNGGAVLTLGEDLSIYGGTLIVTNATITCADDVFCDNGTLILDAGSAVSSADDWEANDHAGRIIVNGGTHSSGPNTDHNVGAQRTGTGIDFRGGTVIAGNFRFQATSVSSVGGSAILTSAAPTTTFSDYAGNINFIPDWTGYWQVGSFGHGDWKTVLTSGSNITLDGNPIDSATFDTKFKVSPDGTTLSNAMPEPVVFGGLLFGLALLRSRSHLSKIKNINN